MLAPPISNTSKGPWSAAVSDLATGIAKWRFWMFLSWEDLRTTYHRSFFGMLWVTMAFGLFVGVKIFIFIPLIRGGGGGGEISSTYYSLHLMLGFFAWTFVQNVFNSAPSVFRSNEAFIKNDPLPLSLFVYRLVMRSIINFLLIALVVAVVLFFLKPPLGWFSLLVIPAFVLFVLNAVWVTLLFGIICTRWRDIGHLIQTIMRLMLFLVPVIWIPSQMGEAWTYLQYNPFAHFVIIMRAPLMGPELHPVSWMVVGGVTILGWLVTLPVFARFRRRVVFWF